MNAPRRWFGRLRGRLRHSSDRRRAEARLAEHERRFGTLIEQVKDYAIFTIDPAGRPTSWNIGVRRVLGYEESEFLGRDVSRAIFTPEDVRAGVPERELAEAAATGAAGNDRWMRRKDGTRFFASGATTSLRDQSGALVGYMKVMRDQTDQWRLQEELRRVAADLARVNRRQTEFLATLGHELRNPLAPIRTGLELMKLLGDDTARAEETRSMMERQTAQLVHLIDDLLDLSRITQGKLQLRICRVALADVIRSAVESVRPAIDQAGHQLAVALPRETVVLDADPTRLAQIVSNLLGNATKYTPEGGHIRLTAEVQGADVLVRVADDGIGIPAEMRAGIFDMFAQIDRPLEHAYRGLGIGLTLVKRLVEMHDGTIDVRSEGEGCGSEFIVRLPLARDPSVAVPRRERPEPPPVARRHRVLVVDDNEAAADSLAVVLEVLGTEVRTAYDGAEALEVAETFRPDLVLMDLRMPRVNGYEAAQRIRERDWGRSTLLVALTGWGQDEDRRRTKEAGFDRHLVKPAEPADLQRLLGEIT